MRDLSRPVESLWGPGVLGEREELILEAERIAHVGTWAWCMSTGRVAWSDELYRILGKDPSRDEATFANFIASIHPDDRDRVYALSVHAAGGDVPERADFRIVRPDGSVRDVMAFAQIFRNDVGVPHRMVGAIMDVTDRILLEQQLVQAQKMEALGRLAGGIAHDFNNLLTVILLNVQALRDAATTPNERLEQIHEAASRAAALTAQLLAFSRRSPHRAVPLDLHLVIATTLGLLERVIGEDVRMSFTPCEQSPVVLAAESQLHQVLLNLALNARDAMPQGGRLTISTLIVDFPKPPAGTSRYVRMSVADTGTGMDAQMRARIFEPFFTTKEGGTGLGLATVFGIVSQCGGFIEVVSEPGKGSTFHVFLPCADVEAEVPASALPQTRKGLGETVLVVEDEEAVRVSLCRLLRRAGYEVLDAEGPAAAIEIWRQHASHIAVLLCDIVMPELDGRQLAARLREERPDLRVVFMTGYAPEDPNEIRTDALWIAKPFTPELLLETLRQVIDSEGGAPNDHLHAKD